MTKTLIVLLIAAAFSGCVLEEPYDNFINFDKKTFDRERAAWNKQGIQNYTVVKERYQDAPGPLGPYRITVLNNAVSDIEFLEEEVAAIVAANPEYEWLPPPYPLTVSDAYDWVASGYETDLARIKKTGGKDRLTIRIVWNTKYHYPEEIYYSFTPNDEETRIGGGGVTITLEEFTPLPVGRE
jgi:hypothetical protein